MAAPRQAGRGAAPTDPAGAASRPVVSAGPGQPGSGPRSAPVLTNAG